MSKETAFFYGSQAWKDCREAYTKSVGGLCELCKKEGMITPAEVVHHKKHITPKNVSDPKVTLSWSNLQALCRRHHEEVHKGKYNPQNNFGRYQFDKSGNLIINKNE